MACGLAARCAFPLAVVLIGCAVGAPPHQDPGGAPPPPRSGPTSFTRGGRVPAAAPSADELPEPCHALLLTGALGEYFHDVDGTTMDSSTRAAFYRARGEASGRESGLGGGVDLETIRSNDRLLVERGVEATRAEWNEIAPYLLLRFLPTEDLRLPVRFGLWFHDLTLTGQSTGERRHWESIGLRVAAGPEWVVLRAPQLEASVAAELTFAEGVTHARVSRAPLGNGTFSTSSALFGLELGPRLRLGVFAAGLSFVFRSVREADSEPAGGVVLPEVFGACSAVALTAGLRF